MDLWDEENKRVKAKWDVILQQELRKEDGETQQRLAQLAGRRRRDRRGAELIEAELGGDKFELVQKQVQQQSIVLAQVANSFKVNGEDAEQARRAERRPEEVPNLGDRRAQVALAPHRAHRGRDRGPPQAPRGADGRLALPPRRPGQLAPADRLPIRTWQAKDDLRLGGRAYAGQPKPRGDLTTSASSSTTSRTTTTLEGRAPRARRRRQAGVEAAPPPPEG